jgi:hypothetical protein
LENLWRHFRSISELGALDHLYVHVTLLKRTSERKGVKKNRQQ